MMAGAPIVAAFVREDFTPPLAAAASRRGMWTESTSLMAMALFPTLIGVVFLIQFGGVIVSPLLSLFVVDLIGGENAALAAGTIMALTGAASAVSALAVGRFGDRLGYSVILPICLLGAAASYFPQAMVEEVWQLLILRLLMGVFLGGLMPSANTLLVRIVPSERRGAAFGLASAAMSLANGIGPLSGAGIATQWGLRAVFLATGALYALASGLVSLSFRRHESRGPRPDLGAS